MPNYVRIFFSEHIPQVTAGFKIAEGVKGHGFASRKYLT